MRSNFVQKEGNHVVQTEQLARDMKEEIERCTKGLESNDARSSCCIYRVPLKFKENNDKHWYRPRIVSIGPYYYRKDFNRDYKYQCLGYFQSRTRERGIGLEDYMKKLHPLETKARQCYSGEINLDSELFDISKIPNEENSPSLSLLALRFFNNIMRRPYRDIERYANPENPPLHLLDLVRSSLIPNDPMPPQKEDDTQRFKFISYFSRLYQKHIPFIPCFLRLPQKDDDTQIQFTPCISKLRRAGMKVRPGTADTFLAVKFEYGVFEIPSITINGFMRYLLLNCVAFEQCHKSCSKHVTVYATLLDCLVNTSADVQYLREHNVIDDYIANDKDVALFINSLGKDVTFDIRDFYLSNLFNDVDKYYRNKCNVNWASFRRTYFYTRWWFLSALAAVVLLLLTLVQTYYAIIDYLHPKK